MKPPIPPPSRILREGGCSGFCDICGSSLKRRWFGLGKVIGCLQPKCWNWQGWANLPAGSNRPIDLYGAPEKPPYEVQPSKPWPRSAHRFSGEEVYAASGLPTPNSYPPMPPVKSPRAGHATGDICERLERLNGDVLRIHGVDISDQVEDLVQFYRDGGDTQDPGG